MPCPGLAPADGRVRDRSFSIAHRLPCSSPAPTSNRPIRASRRISAGRRWWNLPSAFGHDGPVSLKLEFLQHAGSFKTRGAFNTLLSASAPDAGVAAASGGNHGAAVAYAAKRLGVKARIFVPEISSPAKVAVIRSHGAEVVIGGARYADAQAACDLYVAESGALRAHPFDAGTTIAGQGTVALEWEQDGPPLDTVLVAVGGGGLISGIGSWWGGRVKVVGVEPEGSRALHASLEAGEPVDVEINSVAADSLGARNTGDLVFSICGDTRRSRGARHRRRPSVTRKRSSGATGASPRAGRRRGARGVDLRRLSPGTGRARGGAVVRRQCGTRQTRRGRSMMDVPPSECPQTEEISLDGRLN